VGMCQEGACGMAQAGFRASEILRKYYPGALIESMDGL
jgi:peptidoglycan hydrolase-like amidase